MLTEYKRSILTIFNPGALWDTIDVVTCRALPQAAETLTGMAFAAMLPRGIWMTVLQRRCSAIYFVYRRNMTIKFVDGNPTPARLDFIK
jgi:hypothetical protein